MKKQMIVSFSIFALWLNSAFLYAVPLETSKQLSQNDLGFAFGLLADENGSIDAKTLNEIVSQGNNSELKKLDANIGKTAQCLSKVSKKIGEKKSEDLIREALVKDSICACKNEEAYVISDNNQKFFTAIDKIVQDSAATKKEVLYTPDEKAKLAALNEKMYKRMRNGLITDYLATVASLDRPLDSLDKELRHLTPYLPSRMKADDKALISRLLPKHTPAKIKENRAAFFKSINDQLNSLDTLQNKGFDIKDNLPKIADKIINLLAQSPENKVPEKKPVSLLKQPSFLSGLDMPSLVSQRDRLMNPAVESKLVLEQRLQERKKKEASHTRTYEKLGDRLGNSLMDSFSINVVKEIDTTTLRIKKELTGKKQEEALKLLSDFEKQQELLQQNDDNVASLQKQIKRNPLVLSTVRGIKNSNQFEKDTEINPSILSHFGLKGGFSPATQNQLFNKYLEANRELIKEYEEWHEDPSPDGFLKNALYLDPMLSAALIAEDPSLAPLLCKLALNIEKDQLFEEKKERILGIAALVALIGLGAASGGLAYVGAGVLGATIFSGGSLALGIAGSAIEAKDALNAHREAQNLENQLIALQKGDPAEVRETYSVFKRKLAFAVVSGALTAASASSFFKSVKVMTAAPAGSALSLSGQVEVVKGAYQNTKGMVSEGSKLIGRHVSNPQIILQDLREINKANTPEKFAKLIRTKAGAFTQRIQGGKHVEVLKRQAEELAKKAAALEAEKKVAMATLAEKQALLQASESSIKEQGIMLHAMKKDLPGFKRELKQIQMKLKSKMEVIAKLRAAPNREALQAEKNSIDELLKAREREIFQMISAKQPNLPGDEVNKLVTKTMNSMDEIKILKTNQKDLHEAISDFGNQGAFEQKLASMHEEQAALLRQKDLSEEVLTNASGQFDITRNKIAQIRSEINSAQDAVKKFEGQLGTMLEDSHLVGVEIEKVVAEAQKAVGGIGKGTGKSIIEQEASVIMKNQSQDVSSQQVSARAREVVN